jgi:hypothetical protein
MLADHGFRTIALDLRGHGDSAWADDGAYDIVDFAGDLVAIAGSLDRKPALIGASLRRPCRDHGRRRGRPRQLFASLTLGGHHPANGGGRCRARDRLSWQPMLAKAFASPDEAARVISEYLPHRPSRKRVARLGALSAAEGDGRYYWHWDPAFIDGIMRRHDRARRSCDYGAQNWAKPHRGLRFRST